MAGPCSAHRCGLRQLRMHASTRRQRDAVRRGEVFGLPTLGGYKHAFLLSWLLNANAVLAIEDADPGTDHAYCRLIAHTCTVVLFRCRA